MIHIITLVVMCSCKRILFDMNVALLLLIKKNPKKMIDELLSEKRKIQKMSPSLLKSYIMGHKQRH